MIIFIQAIGSDIGFELAINHLKAKNIVIGTYRTKTKKIDMLVNAGAKVFQCDLVDKKSIIAANEFMRSIGKWDALIICSGSQGPIGNFIDVNFDDWKESFNANFVAQMQFIHTALNSRNLSERLPPKVLMFAGGGTNSATTLYSAYTASKIALIKMCELLSAEILDTTFSIVGPGWVNTKIHNTTLLAGQIAGDSYEKTKDMLENNKCIPMERVVACCNWLISADHELVNGRNFSVAYDPWDKEDINLVRNSIDNFKLRRYGSNLFEVSK